FLDTFKFMASPLVNLVQNLKEFPCLSEYFLDKDFLTQKGIYPYDYMDSFERFNETQLPSKENFYNKLNNSHISDKDYVHAQNVWEKYNIKNLGEYHDLYLKTDVLLLADVFEAFRKESSYLMYYDANNLYGWAMSQALPYGKLRWVKEKDYKNVLQLTTLYNKKNYVLHQRNLRQYLSKGLRVEKIHRVLKFNQSHWLKGYIDFNTQRRTESKTDFEKDFYKLMNNAVFGKTMENVRKRQNIRLSTSWEQASKLINRPSFTRAEVFTENFCAIHLIKESIEMNKPIYIGTTILDLSKSLMYDYFYNNLRKKYQNDVNLLYMDTDSFILKINTNDVYSDLGQACGQMQIQSSNFWTTLIHTFANFLSTTYPADKCYQCFAQQNLSGDKCYLCFAQQNLSERIRWINVIYVLLNRTYQNLSEPIRRINVIYVLLNRTYQNPSGGSLLSAREVIYLQDSAYAGFS
uniref:uncharacterized protein n=1 Tax=Myxine glutinosa TaxID=7769 RepID=UPI00358F9C4F